MEKKWMIIIGIIIMIILVVLIGFIYSTTDGTNGKTHKISKEKLIGSWEYMDIQKKVLTWTFFNNDTLKSDFATQGGTGFIEWYYYSVTPDEICFTAINPPDNVTSSVCYECELSEDETELTSRSGIDVVTFTKII